MIGTQKYYGFFHKLLCMILAGNSRINYIFFLEFVPCDYCLNSDYNVNCLVKCLILPELNLVTFSTSIVGIAVEIITLNNF